LLVFAGTYNNRKNFTALRAVFPLECEWVFRYIFEVAIPSLIGEATVERIHQINTDGDIKIYNLLTNCILDKSIPWFGCIHLLCNYHMIDKLFSTKVKILIAIECWWSIAKNGSRHGALNWKQRRNMIFLTMNLGNSWIPIEQKLN
jgi:hypothetical protein